MVDTDTTSKEPEAPNMAGFSKITFEVEVPENTPPKARIYICGDAPALGRWRAQGLHLRKTDDKTYRGFALITQGTHFSWKVTRGRWSTVEKTLDGDERANREGLADEDRHYQIKVDAWADNGEEKDAVTPDIRLDSEPTNIELLGIFGKESTTEDRPVWIHLPPDYDENGTQEYPVLYMLDGQNVFDPATAFLGCDWAADRVHDKLYYDEKIEPFIICAIAHRMDRSYEYTPIPDFFFEGGGLHTLADLIENEIAPALKKRLRVKEGPENTAIMGSSLGGLASFHMAWRHPERFGKAGVISPSLWWAGRHTIKMVSQSFKPASKVRFWIDMGDQESRFPKLLVNSVRQLTNLLKGRGYKAYCYIDKGAQHNELSWRNRLHKPFQWLFPSAKALEEAKTRSQKIKLKRKKKKNGGA